MSIKKLVSKLEEKIKQAYESGTTLEDAEKLAAEFLSAQLQVSDALKVSDLDSRMRKTGVKAVRAAIFLSEVQKADKKPSDSMLEALVNSNDVVQSEQNSLDSAEVDRAELERVFSVLQNGHIFFRGVAKGRFE